MKDKLDVFADGKSTNKAIRELLEPIDEFEPIIEQGKQKYYIIKIDDDLLDKLKRCKKYTNESHSDTIERLLDEFQK